MKNAVAELLGNAASGLRAAPVEMPRRVALTHKRRASPVDGRRGFTIIETIAILAILAILSAIAINRIGSTSTYTLVSETDTLKTHLRYVHFRALSDDVPWGMSFTGTAYTSLRNGATAPYNLPNESSATHTLPAGISVTGPTIAFDEWGSPGIANITITLSSGGETKTITVTKNTGFIP